MSYPPLTYRYAPSSMPGNNNETMLLDTTRLGASTDQTNSNGRIAPSTARCQWAGKRVRATVKNGNQAVTVNLLLMTDPSLATNSAWEVDTTADSAGEIAVSASSTAIIDWLPRTPDYAIELEMGATASDSCVAVITLVDDPSPSV